MSVPCGLCRYASSDSCRHPDRSDTQPTRARWEALPDDQGKRRVLGGAKVGGGAWGLAWVDTVMEMTPQQQLEEKWAKERERYMDLITSTPS